MYKVLTSLLLLLVISACGDDFLEKKPLGQLTSDNFFQTEEHAVFATNATYNILRDWQVSVFAYIGLTDIISDDAVKGSTPTDASFLIDIDNYTFDASNIAFANVWEGYYQGIYRANLAIQRIPEIAEMDEELRQRLLAENHFLRGYFYFNLVRWFGGVPLITAPLPPTAIEQPRATEAAVLDQIAADWELASDRLPARYPSDDVGRVTKGAADGMLARLALWRGDYENTLRYAEAVINSGEYALLPRYQNIFTEAGENSSESVFEVQAAALEVGGGGSQYNEVQGVRGTPNLGWGFNGPSDDLVSHYEPGDPRRDATILFVGEVLPDGSDIVQDNPQVQGERYNQKAWVPEHPGGNGNGPGNIRVLRYADVLLMAAEALNELGRPAEALDYLNAVRARARGTSTSVLPDVTTTDQSALRDLIWRERRSELAMEQQRWWDLKRQGRLAERMEAIGTSFERGKHERLPIPQTEIDLSAGALEQNAGY